MKLFLLCFAFIISASLPATAGEANVEKVDITAIDQNSFRFDVTVRHADEGWEHYVNKWDVTTADGRILGTRTLYHPHVDEQPFTRSLSGVSIPGDVHKVMIRAHDSKHEYGGKTITVAVPHN